MKSSRFDGTCKPPDYIVDWDHPLAPNGIIDFQSPGGIPEFITRATRESITEKNSPSRKQNERGRNGYLNNTNSDGYTIDDSVLPSDFPGKTTNPWTILVTTRYDTSSSGHNNNTLIKRNGSSTTDQIWFAWENNGALKSHLDGTTITATSTVSAGEFITWGCQWDGTNQNVIVPNGGAEATRASTPRTNSYPLYLGHRDAGESSTANHVDGPVYQLFYYNRALTDHERAILCKTPFIFYVDPVESIVGRVPAAGTTINATTANIDISGQAATVNAKTAITATTANLDVTANAATVNAQTAITSTTANVDIGGLLASVQTDTAISATTANVDITALAATVTAGTAITATTANLDMSGQAATVQTDTAITATTANLDVTANAATVVLGTNITATTANLDMAGQAASVKADTDITATTANADITANAATVNAKTAITATLGTVAITANAATIAIGTSISATTANLDISTLAATVAAATQISATTANIDISAYQAGIVSGVITPTHSTRTYAVNDENRAYAIESENRALAIG